MAEQASGAQHGQVLLELAVGACWLAVAWVAYDIQSRRSRRLGIDDYT